MLRRVKADVQSQLPPKRRVVHRIGHDDAVFDKLIANAVRLSSSFDEIKDRLERGRTARMIETETRKATGIAKSPYVAEFVLSLLDAGERVVVYAHHHDVHDEIVDRIERRDRSSHKADGYRPVRISGRESTQEKADAIRKFSEGESRVAVVALRTAAGIDGLQRNGTCVVFAELDWSPAIHSQCEDRLQRIGVDESIESLLCYYLVSSAGSDESMQSALGLKVGQFVGLMGDVAESSEDRDVAMRQAERHLGMLIESLKRRATKGAA